MPVIIEEDAHCRTAGDPNTTTAEMRAVQADGPHDVGLQTTGAQLNLASRQDTAGHAP